MKQVFLLAVFVFLACTAQIPPEQKSEVSEMAFSIRSPGFQDKGNIPEKYTCQGDDINPSLIFVRVPANAKSIALIMDDPDAPVGTWVHWLMWNIPVDANIDEDSVPLGAVQGKNSWGRNDYGGPCPPSGTHRYFFRAYALDTLLSLDESSGRAELEEAMQGHIIAEFRIIGLYRKS